MNNNLKNTVKLALAAVLLLAASTVAEAFNLENHSTVAYIAEQHMTPKAKANFRKAFDNHPLAEFASYPDFFRAIYFVNGKRIVHLVDLDEKMYPVAAPEGQAINAYQGILRAISQLEDYRNLDDSTKYTAMSMLVHFLGDAHCPSHLRYADKRDLKAKDIYYTMYFYKNNQKKEKVGYHTFWDEFCFSKRYTTSFVDRSIMFDTCSQTQIKEIQKGGVEDWIHASAVDCQDLYDVEDGQLVDRVYVVKKAEQGAVQVRNAGYRLAAIMNRIFSK